MNSFVPGPSSREEEEKQSLMLPCTDILKNVALPDCITASMPQNPTTKTSLVVANGSLTNTSTNMKSEGMNKVSPDLLVYM